MDLRFRHAAAGADPADDIAAFDNIAALDQHHLVMGRSEEHTSELQSRRNLVCRLLLEKKNKYPHLV